MKDTSEAIKTRFQNMVMSHNSIDRLCMGCSMFEAAKEIVTSSIKEQHPNMLPGEMKQELFLRFYGMEFSQGQKEKILNALKSS